MNDGENGGPSLSLCLQISNDLSWKVYAFGKEVNSFHSDFPATHLDSSSFSSLISRLNKSSVCIGNPEAHFIEIVKGRKGKITNRNGSVSAILDSSTPCVVQGKVLTETVRTENCTVLTSKDRCESCQMYRKNLRAMYAKWLKINSPSRRLKRSNENSHTNYRYLNTPEKILRMTNLRKQTVTLRRQVESLTRRMQILTDKHGVKVSEDLEQDFRTIVNESDETMLNSYPPDSFMLLFWKQQKEAISKNPKQMRWHPMMIKLCLHIQMLLSSCYNSLRSSGVLKLPSDRTLRDYRNVIHGKAGLQHEVDDQLLKEVNSKNTNNTNAYVSLVFNEVKIQEDLVYDKHTAELIGFTDVTDINEHLLKFEKMCSDDESTVINNPQLATHMLVFIVRGLFSSLKFPYTQFPEITLSGEMLYPIVWQCVERLELI